MYSCIWPKISCHQFGSCHLFFNQFLSFCLQIFENHEMMMSSFVFYADIKKTFDSIPHQKLLIKLVNFSFDHNFLDLMKSYISGHFQRVRIDGFSRNYFCFQWSPPRQQTWPLAHSLLFREQFTGYSCLQSFKIR